MGAHISLDCIKKQLTEYVVMIADTVKTDIEIVDNNLIRILGVGSLIKDAPIISDGIVYKESIKSGKPIIIQTPRKHLACSRCLSHNRCLVTMEVVFPLFYKSVEIGAIGIVCGDFDQKSRVIEELGSHLGFLRMIVNLIEKDLLAYEAASFSKNQIEAYSHYFKLLPDYTLMLYENNTVIDMNYNAQRIFGELHNYTGKAYISLQPDCSEKSIFVTIHGKTIEFQHYEERKFEDNEVRIITFSSPKNDSQSRYHEICRIDDLEMAEISKALSICGNDTTGKRKAAELLGIGVATLYRKLGSFETDKIN